MKKQRLQELLDKMDFSEQEEKQLIAALSAVGITVDSVYDLVNNRPHLIF